MPLDISSYFTSSSIYKLAQKFLLGQNLISKSQQLVADLEAIDSQSPDTFSDTQATSKSAGQSEFDARIAHSIDDILDLREKLGIIESGDKQARSDSESDLKALLSPEKGQKFNSLL